MGEYIELPTTEEEAEFIRRLAPSRHPTLGSRQPIRCRASPARHAYVVIAPGASSDGELGPFALELPKGRVAVGSDLPVAEGGREVPHGQRILLPAETPPPLPSERADPTFAPDLGLRRVSTSRIPSPAEKPFLPTSISPL